MQQNATLVAPIQNAETINAVLTETANGLVLTPKKATKQPLHLKQGVTGKKLVSSKIDTNKAIKEDRKSISSAIRDILNPKLNRGFLESFVNYNEADITPKNLLTMLKENEGKNGFSCWLVMQLITRYYKNI